MTDRPVVGIGGINHDNVNQLMEAGCSSVAVISALYSGGDIGVNAVKFAAAADSFKEKHKSSAKSS